MLYDMQFRGGWKLSKLKQKKTKNYQAKIKLNQNLSRKQTLVASKHLPTEIRTDHRNEMSIYKYLSFLMLIS